MAIVQGGIFGSTRLVHTGAVWGVVVGGGRFPSHHGVSSLDGVVWVFVCSR